MQANTTQRAQLINFMQQYMLSRMQLIAEAASEHEDIDDYANTAEVLFKCYTQIVLDNDVKVLFSSVRGELDTMVYEEVFDALQDDCEFTTEQIYSLT